MGGMISAQFACDYPERVRSLALCDTTAGNAWAGSGGRRRGAAARRRRSDGLRISSRSTGCAELVERENRYRREGDQYARLSATVAR